MHSAPRDFQGEGEAFGHLRGMSVMFLIMDIAGVEADCHIRVVLGRGRVRFENKCWQRLSLSQGENGVVMMPHQPSPSLMMKNELPWLE